MAEKGGAVKKERDERDRVIDEIKRLIAAKYSLVYLITYEENRVCSMLEEIAKSGFSTPLAYYDWSATEGLRGPQGTIPDTENPVKAIDAVIKAKDGALIAMRDLHIFLRDDPMVVRKLRDAYKRISSQVKTIFIVSSMLVLPEELTKEVVVIDFPMPTYTELEKLFDAVVKAHKNMRVELTPDDKVDFIKAAMGLTYDEAKNAFTRACLGRTVLTPAQVEIVIKEKSQQVRREGILDYVPVNYGIDSVGGLKALKEWLAKRTRFFTKEAREFGLSMPKGILLTGVSGCGKSLCAQAISSYWKLPLMRLDLAKVYGGTIAAPEETLRRALKTVEAVSPAILWIEEIEKGVAGYKEGDRGTTARIFSTFLTWMQEKKSPVFVCATANEIHLLPPELLRKGRFDEIFFVDLPREDERIEIFEVHIRKRKQDPKKFNLLHLAKATEGFSGAEIEQVVVSGLFEAFNEKRPLTEQDLYKAIGHTVPLSTTMAEQIKEIKRWADTRAVKAS